MMKATKHNHEFMDYHSIGPLLASVWVDKCTVYFLSTMRVAEPPTGTTCTVKRQTASSTLEDERRVLLVTKGMFHLLLVTKGMFHVPLLSQIINTHEGGIGLFAMTRWPSTTTWVDVVLCGGRG